ncbi:integral membrane protein [Colletotrichum zoysiae]|uniref:Integral membrane protein n=1 Tax=Colletotrichum zoysiae TaxID=1216348 RepID=A0AAD9HP89_9PEZI|nr:integral membrane protein [Colletotrichum zoysiae]
MASRALVPLLVAMMLLTGVCNTLLTKYQDMQCVRNCDAKDPAKRAYFNQPVLQTAQMFVGEMGCWLVVGLMTLYRRYVSRPSPTSDGYQAVNTNDTDEATAALVSNPNGIPKLREQEQGSILRGPRILLLALPAICDILGTTLMNIGLLLVVASIYQMTRGALVLFVGVFSVVFLKRRLFLFQWLSLVGVVVGVALVGLAGAIYHENKSKTEVAADEGSPKSNAFLTVVGVLLIAGAQIFTATQFVLEEWILERSAIEPIRVVGWEGLFGFVVTVFGMVVLHFAIGRTAAGKNGYFDMAEGWRQLTQNRAIGLSSILIMISIGGFNFFGLSVTRSVSATSRSTIDTCRTLFIWIVSLGLRWETFKWLQVAGFALLVYFTFLFNGIVQPPFKFLVPDEEVEELLPEEPIEHQ